MMKDDSSACQHCAQLSHALIRVDNACNICTCQTRSLYACTSPTVRWFGMIFEDERFIVGSSIYRASCA